MLDEFSSLINTKASFMERVNRLFNPESKDYRLIYKAVVFVEYAFRRRKRESDEAYSTHLYAVANCILDLGVRNSAAIAAALLHDIIEDIPGWNFFRVWKHFGLHVATLVQFVTKLQKKSKVPRGIRMWLFYIILSFGPTLSQLIKVCDRLNNVATLEFIEEWKRLRAIVSTKKHYRPMAVRLDAHFPGILKLLDEAIELAEKQYF